MVLDERYVEALWRQYLDERATLASDWRNAFDFISLMYGDPFSSCSRQVEATQGASFSEYLSRFGHLHARLDPLELSPPPSMPVGLAQEGAATLAPLYTGALAVETGHLDDPQMRDWVVAAFEAEQRASQPPDLSILTQLIETEVFDRFMSTRYPGKKRFGSEGADVILPLLHALRREAGGCDVDEMVVGSMHRGRLSILANFAGMDASRLFGLLNGDHTFPDRPDLPGDLTYHLGQSGEHDGVHWTVLPNPSHLEAVNPVVIGFTRGRRAEGSGRAMAVLLHTDASVIGQGVNAELLQMSALAGFEVGGAIHIVINNQIGFTTDPSEARSSRYCTGPWRAVDSLLLHVNGDDVGAVMRAVRLAVRFREYYRRDVVIDVVCYRANGHNEVDEPRFTQPVYYRAADRKTAIAQAYADTLIQAGAATPEDVRTIRAQVEARLNQAFDAAAGGGEPRCDAPALSLGATLAPSETGSSAEADLREIVAALSHVPEGDGAPKMVKLMQRRLDELDGGISWALAESMALAAAVRDGVSVRLCGQDVERGSFSQRHLAAIHPETGRRSHAIAGLARDSARFEVVNSLLSEYAVLGFEYGYSIASHNTLCIWEAQFGDFTNGAQIVIDQFISSGFEKWMQTSGLVVLLPHGLEGQGPEHSSGRVERLLQLCARGNMTVAHPSTPANYFHLLRRQARLRRSPLFVFTPKVLLRLPEARSRLADFHAEATFQPVIADAPGGRADRAVVCSGKIAYEVERLRAEHGAPVAVVRLESLYPFPAGPLAESLAALGAEEILWLQEEPENYGAGTWLTAKLCAVAAQVGARVLPMAARPEAASPAGGFHGWHEREQRALMLRALGVGNDDAG